MDYCISYLSVLWSCEVSSKEWLSVSGFKGFFGWLFKDGFVGFFSPKPKGKSSVELWIVWFIRFVFSYKNTILSAHCWEIRWILLKQTVWPKAELEQVHSKWSSISTSIWRCLIRRGMKFSDFKFPQTAQIIHCAIIVKLLSHFLLTSRNNCWIVSLSNCAIKVKN